MPKGLSIPKNIFFALKSSCHPYPQTKITAPQSRDFRAVQTTNKQKRKEMQMKLASIHTLVIFLWSYISSKEKPLDYFGKKIALRSPCKNATSYQDCNKYNCAHYLSCTPSARLLWLFLGLLGGLGCNGYRRCHDCRHGVRTLCTFTVPYLCLSCAHGIG